MPGKKKAGKKKKKGGKKRDLRECWRILEWLLKGSKSYLDNCAKKKSVVCPRLKSSMKDCYENDRLIVKFILEPVPDFSDPEIKNVSVDPVIACIRHEWYRYIKELHVWDVPIPHEQLANLALMLEKAVYPITRLDLVDCNLEAISATRLVQTSSVLFLTSLCLDYNDILLNILVMLISTAKRCIVLCKCLAMMDVSDCVKDFKRSLLNGNNLEAEGAIEIIKLAADQRSRKSPKRKKGTKSRTRSSGDFGRKGQGSRPLFLRVTKKTTISRLLQEVAKVGKERKRKVKGKERKSKEPPGPLLLPLIHKLHIADNGIDSYGPGSNYGPVIAMRLFRQLLQHSSCFSELDLDDNLIGDLGVATSWKG
ncbi:hypothetical protein BSL78_06777 [Apostichopus japonicus]|uniref:Uncharacterized protein n=1 Tax=Stichopus japonicus TaxID=307972 RepID=A0A2G8L7V1_STIJA|nr:hypothetical protein BSL78_06777 [Apostichopus japonicus]